MPTPSATLVERFGNPSTRDFFKMERQLYETFPGNQLTKAQLDEAANLFTENYGVWGKHSRSPGKPVRLTARRLQEQYLPDSATTSYIRVTVNEHLAGNAFACRWKHGGKSVCWVTQLVVDRRYRERGLASGLLRSIQSDEDDIFGIMSSHPFACSAAASSFGTGIDRVRLDFMKENAEAIMEISPIPYIREAKLCGTLFSSEDSRGLICGVNTGFFVDHEEPLEALKVVGQTWEWPLGELPDGHEYLLILPHKYR